jgi:hypothetical protein
MKMYSTEDLLNRWARDELSILQAIGQILQHLVRLDQEIATLKKQRSKGAESAGK